MKAAIISALFVSLTVGQSINVWNAKARYCALANETASCGDLTNACCGSITTKVGTAAATVVNRCIQRNLVDDIPNFSYAVGATTTTVTYACLSTRPSSYEVYAKCTNEVNCTSGYCCANMNYTIPVAGQTTKNYTQN